MMDFLKQVRAQSDDSKVASARISLFPIPRMSRTCPTCQTTLPDGFPGGLCPKCLLAGAVSSSSGPEMAGEKKITGVPDLAELQGMFPELEILGLLGTGGMGAVFKARQTRLDRLVALKIMVAPPGEEAGFALRFEREAQVLARLSHPRIVIIHDFGDVGKEGNGEVRLHYILMEYVDGTDLAQLIKSGGMKTERALEIVPQICEALQYAHDRGITHRDIKPANILLDAEGRVKVADFGLAKVAGTTVDPMMTGLTRTGSSMGTLHYMAPEQWEHSNQVDHRADLYSLGVVFYEMLTGERPAGVFKPPSGKSGTDMRIDPVVMRAMDKDPNQRYQQASEIRDDLTRCSALPAGPSRVGRRIALAVGLAALIIAGVFLVMQPPQKKMKPASHGSIPPAASENRAKTYRLIMIPMDPEARALSPGAPWDVERSDLIDFQVADTNTNGYKGPPLDHSVSVALTADGKLLDWINTIPGKSIVPSALRNAKVAQFSIVSGDDRSVALLSNGDVFAWKWMLDPENQSVDVTEPEKIDFGRPETPLKIRAIRFDSLLAIYQDGGIEVVTPGFSPIHQPKLEGKAAVADISTNYLALLKDGSLVDVVDDNLKRGNIPLNLPKQRVRHLRAAPYFPSAILEDGTLWYCNENNIDLSVQFLPVIERARESGRIADIQAYQSGDIRYAVKSESGDWFVSHGEMNAAQRKEVKDAVIVFRHEDYVIGLKMAN